MSRLATTFDSLRTAGARALVPYFIAGDPSLETTAQLVIEADRRGADVIELGVPFSDPLADGPVIQRGGQRALAAGVSLVRLLETVPKMRSTVRAPIVLFTYYNPVLAFGLKAFVQNAVQVGVDGVIVPDLPLEEAGELMSEAEASGLDVIHLVAPTTPPARARMIARASRGFIYMVSLTGVTGERSALPADLARQLRALRAITTRPICVGFGISTPEQAAEVGRAADGVIVGSAIVRLVERYGASAELLPRVGDFIAALKAPLKAIGE